MSKLKVQPQLSQKIVPPPTVGEDSGGGERSRTSTPILPFPHHKGEGDEIRNNHVNTQTLLNNIAIRKVTFFSAQLEFKSNPKFKLQDLPKKPLTLNHLTFI